MAKVRYRSRAVEVTNYQLAINNQTGSLFFREPVWGVTPGQSVVLYSDDLVVGGGIIQ
jgi:tRNA-specific 2-thiouridylase